MIRVRRPHERASVIASVVAVALGFLCAPAASDPPAPAVDKTIKLVAMVTVTKSNGAEAYGSGIVFGASSSRVYLMTARHVLRSASKVNVLFRDLPGEPFEAKILAFDSSTIGDLAVVAVGITPELKSALAALAFDAAGDSEDETGSLKSGADVYMLGNPLGVTWHLSGPPPGRVTTPDAVSINFSADKFAEGYSGGALLNSCGQIVGLISGDTGVTGTAMKLAAIQGELLRLTYPVRLSRPSASCSAATPAPAVVLPPARMAVSTANNNSVRCPPSSQSCSPDGKWRATIVTLSIQAQSGARLANSKLSCSGPESACAFCDTPAPLVSGSLTATVTVRCWSLPVFLTLQADQI